MELEAMEAHNAQNSEHRTRNTILPYPGVQAQHDKDITKLIHRVDIWAQLTRETVANAKSTVDTVNALVVVAAFIAGVQAQIISFTLNFVVTPLERVTNVCAFLGLVLDIIGTALGVLHTIHLQSTIRDQSILLAAITKLTKDLGRLHNPSDIAPQEKAKILVMVTRMEEIMKQDVRIQNFAMTVRSVTAVLPGMLPVPVPVVMLELPWRMLNMLNIGAIPLAAMTLGIFFLLSSVLLLAARTLPPETWIICLVTVLSVVVISVVPIVTPIGKWMLAALRVRARHLPYEIEEIE